MEGPIPNRHALEELWRERVEQARRSYELARNSLREVRQQFGSEPNADGTYIIHQSVHEETLALTEYLLRREAKVTR